ncbi:hypothetical protein [Actinoplanes sp. NPDC051851]|uniref:hypothetical protein n=1 Tax=Actinoplanes sp. NPDC051851 TaxID=3154753 RepID=UPI003431179C
MLSTVERGRRVRRRCPYTESFRALDADAQKEELRLLKTLYEQHGLSMRQIADLTDSSFGFIQLRLTDVGASVTGHRRKRPPITQEITDVIAALPSRRRS